MGSALSEEAKQLVDRPNFAHLATIMPDLHCMDTRTRSVLIFLQIPNRDRLREILERMLAAIMNPCEITDDR